MSESTVSVEDVVYRRAGDLDLQARLYGPAAPGRYPGLVSVHGGAWVGESRLSNVVIDQALARAGFIVAALDFRMPPTAMYPRPIQDIHYAIRWLKHRGRELGLSSERVGGVGTSSGGHQLMSAALRPHDLRYAALKLPDADDVTAELAYVALGWPVVDPASRFRMALDRGMDKHISAHRAYWPSEAAMAEGSPQHVLERGEAAALPPTLLLQGTADEALPPDMADRFAAAYARAGGALDLVKFPGQGHTFITKQPDTAASRAAIAAIVAFAKRQAGEHAAQPLASQAQTPRRKQGQRHVFCWPKGKPEDGSQ